MRPRSGGHFWFDPGARCLELVYTGGADGIRAQYETWHGPSDLTAWLSDHTGTDVTPAGESDLTAATRLREAVWHGAEARIEDRPLPPDAIEDINASAELPSIVPRLAVGGVRTIAAPVTAGQVLSTLARDAVELFTGPRADRIRRCAGVNCELVFVDTSRPGLRRWCSMERCGNRAKATTFRDRHRQEGSTS
jgi:predicted RNA-binding Zn ribbon-like protein